MAQKKDPEAGASRRLTVALAPPYMAMIEAARPLDGSLADGVRALIDIAVKADEVERQNRDLVAALTSAMTEMAASLTEIRDQVARLDAERR